MNEQKLTVILHKVIVQAQEEAATNRENTEMIPVAIAALNQLHKDSLREARIAERKKSWHEIQELEEIYDKSLSADKSGEYYAVLRDAYRYHEKALAQLNREKL